MTISDADIEFIHSKIQPLIGLKSWNVFRQFGSYLYFDFGELKLTKWGETGESQLVILDCAWQIETSDGVLTGNEDVHPIMDKHVKKLEDQAIVSFTVTKPCLDTTITFENGLTLRLFPRTNKEDHWFFSNEDHTLSLDSGASYRYYNHNEGFSPKPLITDDVSPIFESDIQSVQSILDVLVGTKIFGVGHGSMENPIIYFKVKGKKILWELMLLNVDWRLETETEFLAGSLDQHRSLSFKTLNEHLKDKRLKAVEITRPAFDTTFIFKDNLKLRFFTYISQRATHYTLKMPDERTLYVGPDTKWSVEEPRKPKKPS